MRTKARFTATPGPVPGKQKDLTPNLDRLNKTHPFMADKIRNSRTDRGLRSVADARNKAQADGNRSEEAIQDAMAKQYLDHRGMGPGPSIAKDAVSEFQKRTGDTVTPRARKPK